MEPLKGKNLILLFRLLEDAAKGKAAKLAFQTEHSVEKSRDSDITETKDGPLPVGQGMEEEIPFNCIMAQNDPVAKMLDDALVYNKVVEVWEVDVTPKEEDDGKYPAVYRQGLITEYNKAANVEDLITLECTFITSGIGQRGEVTLTQEQREIVQYKFRDTEVYNG